VLAAGSGEDAGGQGSLRSARWSRDPAAERSQSRGGPGMSTPAQHDQPVNLADVKAAFTASWDQAESEPAGVEQAPIPCPTWIRRVAYQGNSRLHHAAAAVAACAVPGQPPLLGEDRCHVDWSLPDLHGYCMGPS
jgi:hypothetical protein